jgi:hypothetical protein
MRKAIPTFVVLLATVWTGRVGALSGSDERTAGHQSHIVAHVTTEGETERSITIEGVGCWESLCSRVAVRGKAAGNSHITTTWLDTIAVIRDITGDDAAVVLRNGTVQRLAIIHDNRVIYFLDQYGRAGKLDLVGVKSIEFVDSTR